jgi:hypothetical protein
MMKWAPSLAVALACGATISASLAAAQPVASRPARPRLTRWRMNRVGS